MQIDLLDTFLDLAETRSFHRTAEKLGITQSTVSARVAALEQAVGSRLFDRSRAGTDLTPEGRRFEPHARALRHEWNEAKRRIVVPQQARASGTAGHPERPRRAPSRRLGGRLPPRGAEHRLLYRARLLEPDVRRPPDRHPRLRGDVQPQAAPRPAFRKRRRGRLSHGLDRGGDPGRGHPRTLRLRPFLARLRGNAPPGHAGPGRGAGLGGAIGVGRVAAAGHGRVGLCAGTHGRGPRGRGPGAQGRRRAGAAPAGLCRACTSVTASRPCTAACAGLCSAAWPARRPRPTDARKAAAGSRKSCDFRPDFRAGNRLAPGSEPRFHPVAGPVPQPHIGDRAGGAKSRPLGH
jgi:DNA-binding transcriptional LysR family regulator